MMDNVSKEIAEFLRRKGGVGLVVSIDKKSGSTFTELVSKVHVSRNTLSTRFDEAVEIQLIREVAHPSDHGNAVRYALTKRGKQVHTVLDDYRMASAYSDLLRARKNIEAGIDFFEEVYEPKSYDPLIDELDDELHI
jgi:DNA-binding HxlR family transcriptional regulator